MPVSYPADIAQKPHLTTVGNVRDMLLWGFWVLAILQSPTSSSAQLALGLAVVAAALLMVVAAAGLPIPTGPARAGFRLSGDRARRRRVSRLTDPDAAGRPRPRAPSTYPAAA
jgi:hypothetical protein